MFAYEGGNAYGIANRLNAEGKRNHFGRPWRNHLIYAILSGEKYIGHYVYNRESWRLKEVHRHNPPGTWVRAPNVFEPIVEPELFEAAQAERRRRATLPSDEEMLRPLSALLLKKRRLTAAIIDKTKGIPSSERYKIRFGTLSRAYELAGFRPRRDARSLAMSRVIRQLHPRFLDEVVAVISRAGAAIVRDVNRLRVNEELSLLVTIARCYRRRGGHLEWRVRLDESRTPDITIAARMDEENTGYEGYFILPHFSVGYPAHYGHLTLEEGTFKYEGCRFDSLDRLIPLFTRTEIAALRRPVPVDSPTNGIVGSEALQLGSLRVRKSRKLIKSAASARNLLQLAGGTLRELLSEDHCATMLRAEGMTTLPKLLAEQVCQKGDLSAPLQTSNRAKGEAGRCVDDLLHLAIAKAYVSRLTKNIGVVRYLRQNHRVPLKKLLLVEAGHVG
jgi:hypothetical protein